MSKRYLRIIFLNSRVFLTVEIDRRGGRERAQLNINDNDDENDGIYITSCFLLLLGNS